MSIRFYILIFLSFFSFSVFADEGLICFQEKPIFWNAGGTKRFNSPGTSFILKLLEQGYGGGKKVRDAGGLLTSQGTYQFDAWQEIKDINISSFTKLHQTRIISSNPPRRVNVTLYQLQIFHPTRFGQNGGQIMVQFVGNQQTGTASWWDPISGQTLSLAFCVMQK